MREKDLEYVENSIKYNWLRILGHDCLIIIRKEEVCIVFIVFCFLFAILVDIAVEAGNKVFSPDLVFQLNLFSVSGLT